MSGELFPINSARKAPICPSKSLYSSILSLSPPQTSTARHMIGHPRASCASASKNGGGGVQRLDSWGQPSMQAKHPKISYHQKPLLVIGMMMQSRRELVWIWLAFTALHCWRIHLGYIHLQPSKTHDWPSKVLFNSLGFVGIKTLFKSLDSSS